MIEEERRGKKEERRQWEKTREALSLLRYPCLDRRETKGSLKIMYFSSNTSTSGEEEKENMETSWFHPFLSQYLKPNEWKSLHLSC